MWPHPVLFESFCGIFGVIVLVVVDVVVVDGVVVDVVDVVVVVVGGGSI